MVLKIIKFDEIIKFDDVLMKFFEAKNLEIHMDYRPRDCFYRVPQVENRGYMIFWKNNNNENSALSVTIDN